MREISLGTELILDAPAGSRITARDDQVGRLWPHTDRTELARIKVTYPLRKSAPELYLRRGRVMLDVPSTSFPGAFSVVQCQLQITSPVWRVVQVNDSFSPTQDGVRSKATAPATTITPGLGLVLRGRGTTFVASADDPPHRIATALDAGEAAWVFTNLEPGAYSVGADVSFPGYGTTTVQVPILVNR